MGQKAKVALNDPKERIDQLKLQLCDDVKRACWRQGWNQIQSAYYCGTSRSCISKVDHLRIEELTVAQLFRYLACAAPDFEMLVKF
jgi:hypothetical protein